MLTTILKPLLASRCPRPPLSLCLGEDKVRLRMGRPKDWRVWRDLREISRPFLEPWEPTWPKDALAASHFLGTLRRQRREWREGTGYSFLIFAKSAQGGATLVGAIGLTEIVQAAAQKGTLGYWIGLPYADQGLMTEAVQLVLTFAFGDLALQRVEASCMPSNEPSKRLLQRLGFVEEGLAKAYLQINGRREDHMLWGRTREA